MGSGLVELECCAEIESKLHIFAWHAELDVFEKEEDNSEDTSKVGVGQKVLDGVVNAGEVEGFGPSTPCEHINVLVNALLVNSVVK